MNVYLLKDIEKIGLKGEIVKVGDGYARNYLIPRNLGIEVTKHNYDELQKRVRNVEHRKEVIASQTSMLAEKIKTLKITLKRKLHDNGKLYGAIKEHEIVEALADHGISIAKSQVMITKAIKERGTHQVTIKLTSQLKPMFTLVVAAENA